MSTSKITLSSGSTSGRQEEDAPEIQPPAPVRRANVDPVTNPHHPPRTPRTPDVCVDLYEAAVQGDWKAAKQRIESDPTIVGTDIAHGGYTPLHVAAGARRVNFVEEMLKRIRKHDFLTHVLRLPDERGNTAFSLAAAAGSLEILKIMIRKDPDLLETLGGEGKTPLYIAALFGHEKVAACLYSHPAPPGEDLLGVFFTCINSGLYSLASIILERHPQFSFERDGDKKTPLHLLAEKPSAFAFKRPGCWMRCKRGEAIQRIRNYPDLADQFEGQTILQIIAQSPLNIENNQLKYAADALKALEEYPELALERDDNNLKEAIRSLSAAENIASASSSPASALVRKLWHNVITGSSSNFEDILRKPTNLVFDAVKSGNSKFVTVLLRTYPALIWEKDRKMTIMHTAVSLRHASIYKLIHEIGLTKDVIVTFKDNKKNTLLHLAAQSAPKNQLDKLFGAAFQMQRELVWFEEVKKIMQPAYIEMKNSNKKTPQEVFTSAHRTLLKDAEKWMNETARSCMVVSTLIVSALFAAGITVSVGGNTSDHHLKKASFRIFLISDAIALFLSLIATLMFFYIVTSRYSERDFLKDLPLKLITGLVLLFLSIIAMMVAFSSASFVAYGRKDPIPYVVTGCASVPVVLYNVLLFPLLKDVMVSTFCSRKLFRPKGKKWTVHIKSQIMSWLRM